MEKIYAAFEEAQERIFPVYEALQKAQEKMQPIYERMFNPTESSPCES